MLFFDKGVALHKNFCGGGYNQIAADYYGHQAKNISEIFSFIEKRRNKDIHVQIEH